MCGCTEAIKACRKALRAAPDHPGAHYVIGLSYVGLGDSEHALMGYRVLEKLDREMAGRLFVKIPKR